MSVLGAGIRGGGGGGGSPGVSAPTGIASPGAGGLPGPGGSLPGIIPGMMDVYSNLLGLNQTNYQNVLNAYTQGQGQLGSNLQDSITNGRGNGKPAMLGIIQDPADGGLAHGAPPGDFHEIASGASH